MLDESSVEEVFDYMSQPTFILFNLYLNVVGTEICWVFARIALETCGVQASDFF